MNTFKSIFRTLLVMLFLWMISLLVYYWPLPEEVLPDKATTFQEHLVNGEEADRRVRVLPLD